MVSQILEHDHEQLAALLRDLQSSLQSQDPARVLELLDLFWARLGVHIRAENLVLFPAILSAHREFSGTDGRLPSFAETESAIQQLRTDHSFFMDELAKAVKTMRATLAGVKPPQSLSEQFDEIRKQLAAVARQLESHNVLEEEQVYKWPALMLGSAAIDSLCGAIRRELENAPPRFDKRW